MIVKIKDRSAEGPTYTAAGSRVAAGVSRLHPSLFPPQPPRARWSRDSRRSVRTVSVLCGPAGAADRVLEEDL